jgi:hypothetical protein
MSIPVIRPNAGAAIESQSSSEFRNNLQCAAIGYLQPRKDTMTFSQINYCKRRTGRTFKSALVLGFVVLALSPANLAAQGLPVQNGPMFPVALWWIGAFILGFALIYGILRNRRRTRAEKQLTERAAKELIAEESRDEERASAKSVI